jgi:hypothetical protein
MKKTSYTEEYFKAKIEKAQRRSEFWKGVRGSAVGFCQVVGIIVAILAGLGFVALIAHSIGGDFGWRLREKEVQSEIASLKLNMRAADDVAWGARCEAGLLRIQLNALIARVEDLENRAILIIPTNDCGDRATRFETNTYFFQP